MAKMTQYEKVLDAFAVAKNNRVSVATLQSLVGASYPIILSKMRANGCIIHSFKEGKKIVEYCFGGESANTSKKTIEKKQAKVTKPNAQKRAAKSNFVEDTLDFDRNTGEMKTFSVENDFDDFPLDDYREQYNSAKSDYNFD